MFEIKRTKGFSFGKYFNRLISINSNYVSIPSKKKYVSIFFFFLNSLYENYTGQNYKFYEFYLNQFGGLKLKLENKSEKGKQNNTK
jgi:hypothetical protein